MAIDAELTVGLTLPQGPLPLAMDYERLRAEGLRLLGRLAAEQWTDFNTHDPGITILEQLCYAITDLGYRTNFPIADLLATPAGHNLPGPSELLVGGPVTTADLRQHLLDMRLPVPDAPDASLSNAWVEPAESALAIYHHASRRELWFRPVPNESESSPVRLVGLSRVLLEPSQTLSGSATLATVAARLQRCRPLGEDLDAAWLETFELTLTADIEVDVSEEPVALLAQIIGRINASLRPGRSDETSANAELPSVVRASHLIRAIMDVPAVRAVRALTLPDAGWAVDVPAAQVAVLSPRSELRLFRAGVQIEADFAAAMQRIRERERNARAWMRVALPQPKPGRPRTLALHRSLQRQLPAAYGVGLLGLAGSVSAGRRAQARQLEAYLLIFDQLLANAFAQLAHAHELLSPAIGEQTYFAQPVDDPPLRLAELLEPAADGLQAWLAGLVQPKRAADERRRRFLAHLLARFGEQLDHAADLPTRQAFLRDYPGLSRARGAGCDLSAGSSETTLERRLRVRLGLDDKRTHFHVVERILLRPLAEDAVQSQQDGVFNDEPIPLLAEVEQADPWSLQLDFVFEDRPGIKDSAWEQGVAQAIVAETPAHLVPRLWWLAADGVDNWQAFDAAWRAFRDQLRAYRSAGPVPLPLALATRDARDRVIDMLGFARSYPLRDLPVSGDAQQISLGFSQRGVRYQLYEWESGKLVASAEGVGGRLELAPAAAASGAVTYRIRATKLETTAAAAERGVWLHAVIRSP